MAEALNQQVAALPDEHRPALRAAADQVLAGASAHAPIGQDARDLTDRHRIAVGTIDSLGSR